MTDRIADIFPLTPAQAGMLVSILREPEPGLYVVQMRFALSGRVDVARLTAAWDALVARHQMLRTAIIWDKSSTPVNVVMTDAAMPVAHVDLKRQQKKAQSAEVSRFLTGDRRRGFDLTQAPLSRITLLDLGDGEQEMVWTHHHLILDGWSAALVIAELWRLYAGGDLPGAPPEFQRFAARIASETRLHRTEASSHWNHLIADGAARISIDKPQRDHLDDPWTHCNLPIGKERLDRWDAARHRHRTTRSTLAHAAWAMALREAGLGPDELIFGTVADSRGATGADVVGMCVASTPMRIKFTDMPVSQWLQQISIERAISQELAGDLSNYRRWTDHGSEVPFRYILAVEGYAHAGLSDPNAGDELAVRFLGVRESTEFALTAGMPPGNSSLKLTIDTRRISVANASNLLDRWAEALDALAAALPDQSVSNLVAQGPRCERLTLHEHVYALAAEKPGLPAFRDSAEVLTLSALVRDADAIATFLHAHGVHVGDRVGILSDGTVGVPIAMLAILAVGGVVVPLDPRHPAPYRRAVVAEAGLRRVLTPTPDVRPEWSGVVVDSISSLRSGPSHCSALVRSGCTDTAFLVYDGGSALLPRAAKYDHSDVVNAAACAASRLGLAAGSDWVISRASGGVTPPGEMWIAPLVGGCTVLEADGSDEYGVVDELRTSQLPVSAEFDADDIERVLIGRPGIASCVVQLDPLNGLKAVVSATDSWSVRELTRAFRSALPERLVPRVELAEPGSVPNSTRQLQCERDLCRLWSRVLDLPDVPIDTPFFDLGGDSLLLFAVLSGLRGGGWTDVTMTDLFAYPTIRSLSERLARRVPAARVSAEQGITRSRRDAVAARRERRTR